MQLFEIKELFSPFSLVENIKWNPKIKDDESISYVKLLKSLAQKINNEVEKNFPTYPYRLKILDKAPNWTGRYGKSFKIALLEKDERIQKYGRYEYSVRLFIEQDSWGKNVLHSLYNPVEYDKKESLNYLAQLQAHTIFKMIVTKLFSLLSDKKLLSTNFYIEAVKDDKTLIEWANAHYGSMSNPFVQNFFDCSIYSNHKDRNFYFINRKDVENHENTFRKQQLIHHFLQNNSDVFVMKAPSKLNENENEYIKTNYDILFNFKGLKLNLKFENGEYMIQHMLNSSNRYANGFEGTATNSENIPEEAFKDENVFVHFITDFVESVELEYELNGKDYSYLFSSKFTDIEISYNPLTSEMAMIMMEKICETTGKTKLEIEKSLFTVNKFSLIQKTNFQLDELLLQLLIYQIDHTEEFPVYLIVFNKVDEKNTAFSTKYDCFSKDEFKEKEKNLKSQFLTEIQKINNETLIMSK